MALRSNELMVGDLVRVNRDGLCIKKDTIVQVRGIDGDDKIEEKGLIGAAHCRPLDREQFDGGIWVDYLDPIPLTPEILEKNGWFYPKQSSWMKLDNQHRELWGCIHTDGTLWLYSSGDCDKDESFAEIKYVHELQHALRLCGIEKEITI